MLRLAGLAVGMLGQNITVYEETSARQKGRALPPVVGKDRTIFGAIQSANDKAQQQKPEGSRTDGELILQTSATIYYRNVTNGNNRETRQTFVKYQGETWRVKGVRDGTDHSGKRRYTLSKYVKES